MKKISLLILLVGVFLLVSLFSQDGPMSKLVDSREGIIIVNATERNIHLLSVDTCPSIDEPDWSPTSARFQVPLKQGESVFVPSSCDCSVHFSTEDDERLPSCPMRICAMFDAGDDFVVLGQTKASQELSTSDLLRKTKQLFYIDAIDSCIIIWSY